MRMGRLATCACVAGAIAACAIACRQLVGIGDNPPQGALQDDASPSVCDLPLVGACAECVKSSCCTEATNCAKDPSCSSLASCSEECGGAQECLSKCLYQSAQETPSANFAPLHACQAAHCESQCGLTCGGIAFVYSPRDAAVACQACMTTNGCDTERSCAAAESCEDYGQCVVACQGRIDCTSNCAVVNDAGRAVAAPLGKLAAGTCSQPCQTGDNWECIGHLSPPAPQVTSTLATMQVLDMINQRVGVPGAQVSVCGEGKCDPVAGLTDDAGDVTFGIPLPPQTTLGPTGYVHITSVQDGGLVPALFYWGSPLSAPTMTLTAWAASPVEVALLEGQTKVTQDPMHGLLIAVAVDCIDQAAPGIVFSLQPKDTSTEGIYLVDEMPSATAMQTDRSGTAIFANVPAGTVTVTATFGVRPVGHVDVLVQAGAVTETFVPPSSP